MDDVGWVRAPFLVVGHLGVRAAVVEGAAYTLGRGGQGLLPICKMDSGMRIIGERRLQDDGSLHRNVDLFRGCGKRWWWDVVNVGPGVVEVVKSAMVVIWETFDLDASCLIGIRLKCSLGEQRRMGIWGRCGEGVTALRTGGSRRVVSSLTQKSVVITPV